MSIPTSILCYFCAKPLDGPFRVMVGEAHIRLIVCVPCSKAPYPLSVIDPYSDTEEGELMAQVQL